MQVLAICLGLLSCVYLSECAFTDWTTPLLAVGTGNTAGTGNAGVVYFNEGVSTIQTVAAVVGSGAIVSYAIETQTVSAFFVISAGTGGVITAAAGALDADTGTTSHVLTIVSVDDTATPLSATVTVTYSIIAGQFAYGSLCRYLEPNFAVGAVITNAMSSTGTNVITIDSGNTNTDFAVDSGTGAITTLNIVTTASGTSGSYTLLLKGIENIGTASTEYSTLNVCVRGSTCVCTSAAATLTTGLLVMIAAAIMMLLK